MIKVNMFSLNIGTLIIRFYLMMAIIIIGVFSGWYWLALFGLPVFLSALMGIRWVGPAKVKTKTSQRRIKSQVITRKAS